MAKGPDFLKPTIDTLAKRAGLICSKPDCKAITGGPHSDPSKARNIGEAAHIYGARPGSARYNPDLTDEQRSNISNGIWLCRTHAREIDGDEHKYPVELLHQWKQEHEQWIERDKPERFPAAREISVKGGGVGSVIDHRGEGTSLEIIQDAAAPAERITVEGSGIGEIISHSGRGTAKRIISTGGKGSETTLHVTGPTMFNVGMYTKTVLTNCQGCGQLVTFGKTIQAIAAAEEPKVIVSCPHCGAETQV